MQQTEEQLIQSFSEVAQGSVGLAVGLHYTQYQTQFQRVEQIVENYKSGVYIALSHEVDALNHESECANNARRGKCRNGATASRGIS